ncbi:glycosyltransferase family 87 protein [Gordonia sp. (in: high G+C Gram-positive bacteria)]|uniref:glycosyltransferase family 87 protein n=1 Tax=Gordonia sp. (in: high G+C Gram-positive bacteria) TaxID=84139 RepID=UPI0039E5A4B6
MLWPIAVMLMFQRTVILAINGARTDDFVPVYNASYNFLNRLPLYAENYTTVDPHYLYPPSGALLMGPLALLNPDHARWLFLAASVIALIASAYLLCRLFGQGAGTWLFPTILVFFFLTESVTNTLVFANFNAFVLLGLVAFMLLMRAHRDLWAGVMIGLTLCVKPVLAPLLLLPLLNRQPKILITAIGVPVVLNAVAWPLVTDPMDFIQRTAPYIFESRDYYNSSITGLGAYFGVAGWLILLLRIAFLAMAVFSLWFLYRYYRERDDLLWLTTSSGVLLTTLWLVGSLGQGYYSMLLFPMVLTVLRPGSVVRNWPAWLALYGCLTFDSFTSKRWEPLGRWLDYSKVTFGWSLLMVVVFCVLLFRWLDLRAANLAGQGPSESSTVPDVTNAATVEG